MSGEIGCLCHRCYRSGHHEACDAAKPTNAVVYTRRVYGMRRSYRTDELVMCWATVPANATCMDLEAIDTPSGDMQPIVAIDYDAKTFVRDDPPQPGQSDRPRCIPAHADSFLSPVSENERKERR